MVRGCRGTVLGAPFMSCPRDPHLQPRWRRPCRPHWAPLQKSGVGSWHYQRVGEQTENLGFGHSGVQEPMSVVQRPQLVCVNSVKGNHVAAVNELMRTPARGRAPGNSLPSPSAAICPLPKSGPMTPTADDANSFTWNAWRFTVLPQCTFPTPLLLFFRLDLQGPQGWGRCGGCASLLHPLAFHVLLCLVGVQFIFCGAGRSPLTFKYRFKNPSSGSPCYI